MLKIILHRLQPQAEEIITEEQSKKKTSNDQELIQSDPTSRPQNQKGNN